MADPAGSHSTESQARPGRSRPPRVSVIVPCRNEERTVTALLDGLLAQSFPCGDMEVVVADGMSEDGTRDRLESWAREHPALTVRVVENPARNIPAGLNRALAAARGRFLVRLDAHSVPAPDYIERCVRLLEAGRGDNVGGLWEIRPGGPGAVARAIAVAAAHPLGAGDARYRRGGEAGPVDTVPFGAFRRETLEELGGFDETLLSNEDYELNLRLRSAGGIVWFDPAIRCAYFARATLRGVAGQYWRYGSWKWHVVRRYPGSLRWRQILPPLFVLALAASIVAAAAVPGLVLLPLVLLAPYGLVLLAAGALAAVQRRDPALLPFLPAALAVMHLAWGAGFLRGALGSLLPGGFRRRSRSR